MCNLSSQSNNSVSMFKGVLQWHCVCQDHFAIFAGTVIASLFFILGIPINCWSLWVVLRRNMTPNIVFSLNITVQQLIFASLCFFDLILVNRFPVSNYQMVVFLIGLYWTVKPLLQICMCIEQYLAVVHPVTFLRYKDVRYRIALAAAAWIIGVVNCLRLIFIEEPFFPDHVFFLLFCTAVMIISFCCVSVLCVLRDPGPGAQKKVEMTEKDRQNKTDRGRAVENQQKRKAFRIISHVLVSILVCYVPQVVGYFMLIAEISSQLYICVAFPIILSFTMITVLLSPLIRMYSEGQMKNIMCFSKFREQM